MVAHAEPRDEGFCRESPHQSDSRSVRWSMSLKGSTQSGGTIEKILLPKHECRFETAGVVLHGVGILRSKRSFSSNS